MVLVIGQPLCVSHSKRASQTATLCSGWHFVTAKSACFYLLLLFFKGRSLLRSYCVFSRWICEISDLNLSCLLRIKYVGVGQFVNLSLNLIWGFSGCLKVFGGFFSCSKMETDKLTRPNHHQTTIENLLDKLDDRYSITSVKLWQKSLISCQKVLEISDGHVAEVTQSGSKEECWCSDY